MGGSHDPTVQTRVLIPVRLSNAAARARCTRLKRVLELRAETVERVVFGDVVRPLDATQPIELEWDRICALEGRLARDARYLVRVKGAGDVDSVHPVAFEHAENPAATDLDGVIEFEGLDRKAAVFEIEGHPKPWTADGLWVVAPLPASKISLEPKRGALLIESLSRSAVDQLVVWPAE